MAYIGKITDERTYISGLTVYKHQYVSAFLYSPHTLQRYATVTRDLYVALFTMDSPTRPDSIP